MAKTAQAIVVADDLDGQILQYTDATGLTVDNIDVFTGATSGKTLVEIGSKTRKTTIAKIRAATKALNPNITYLTNDYDDHGQWVVDNSDNSLTDNTGTVLVTAFGDIVKRKFEGPVHSKWFATKADGATDDTAILQSIFNNFKNIRINAGTHMVDASATAGYLKPLSDSHIEFDQGAILKVIPNDLDAYKVIEVDNVSGVTIKGGSIVGDKSTHTGTTGEAGMMIYIQYSHDIKISNMVFSDAWGDGVYIGNPATSSTDPNAPYNITLNHLDISNCRRNGISVTNGKGIKFSNITCHDIQGTDPQNGIDIEPNTNCIAEDLTFSNIIFYNNTGRGIGFAGGKNIVISNIVSHDNAMYGVYFGSVTNINIMGVISYNNTLGDVYGSHSKGVTINGGAITESVAGVYFTECYGDITVSAVLIADNTGGGLFVKSTTSAFINLVISGNTIVRNTGTGVVSFEKAVMVGNIINSNGIDGVYLGMNTSSEGGSTLIGNQIYENGDNGIELYQSDSIISGNDIHSNSQASNGVYNNIYVIDAASNNLITGNKIKKGSLANKPKANININESTNVGNILYKNALGEANSIIDAGTNTLYDYDLLPVTYISANTIQKNSDRIVMVDTSAGNVTYTLMPSSVRGPIRIIKISDDSNTMAIKANGSETINGAAQLFATGRYDFYEITQDGTTNYITGELIGDNAPVPITDTTTIDYTTATLQSAYGTKKQGQIVVCPDIAGGAQAYILYDKANGRWGAINFQILPNSG